MKRVFTTVALGLAGLLGSCSPFSVTPKTVQMNSMQAKMEQGKYHDAYCIGLNDYSCLRYKLARNVGLWSSDYQRYLKDMYTCSSILDASSDQTNKYARELQCMGALPAQAAPPSAPAPAANVGKAASTGGKAASGGVQGPTPTTASAGRRTKTAKPGKATNRNATRGTGKTGPKKTGGSKNPQGEGGTIYIPVID